MIRLRTIAVLVFVVMMGLFTLNSSVAATEGPADCGAYQAATPTDEPNCGSSGELSPDRFDSGEDGTSCPEGYAADGPHTLCYPVVEEGLNDGWYDNQGNLVPNQDECPEGYFIWYTPENNHDICSAIPEDVSGPVEATEEESSVNTDGGHEAWRESPRGRCNDWMDFKACMVWQAGYNFPDENRECVDPAATLVEGSEETDWFTTCQIITIEETSTPEAVEIETPVTSEPKPVVETTDGDSDVAIVQGPVNGPVDSDQEFEVTALPNTGHGVVNPEPPLTSQQAGMVKALIVLSASSLLVGGLISIQKRLRIAEK